MTLAELLAQRDSASKAYRDLVLGLQKEQKFPGADERAKMDAIVADIERLDGDIREAQGELEKRMSEMDTALQNMRIGDRGGDGGGDSIPADEKAFRDWLSTNDEKLLAESRAMTTGTGSTGGYLVPDKFHKELKEYQADLCPIYELATKSDWDGDAVFPLVSGFGTTELVAEGSNASGTTPTIGQKNLTGYQFIYMVDVPWTLLRKSAFNIEAKLPKWWGKSNAGKMEDYFAEGTGSAQPKGLAAAATTGEDTAANSAIAGDDVVNWFFKLKAAYRKRATWLFADSTIAMIRKIKNPVTTSGALQYIWMPGLGGQPETLMGKPIKASDGFSAFTAGAACGVFGDISEYQIVEFGKPALIQDGVSRANYAQTRMVGYRLVDADLPVAEAVVTCPVAS